MKVLIIKFKVIVDRKTKELLEEKINKGVVILDKSCDYEVVEVGE